ncbi:Rap1a/Tai family immunity protein [Nitrosomonas communis]
MACPPDPKPSRNQAVENYVEWMKTHPEYLKELAVDTVMKFLIEIFPCA